MNGMGQRPILAVGEMLDRAGDSDCEFLRASARLVSRHRHGTIQSPSATSLTRSGSAKRTI